MQKW